MATYKVIQDVEAEDKILGPLSLKQLIFAAITAGTIFIAFRLVVATEAIYVAIPFVPIVLVFGVLAAPLGRDQPTELWLAAQIRFYTKPRVRIWDQSGIKKLVTITAPIKEEKIYTDGLDQQQVRSRLSALSSTLDSRGWAVKNIDINMNASRPTYNMQSDRIIDPSSLPIMVSDVDVRPSDDILDVNNNDTAHHFDELMQTASKNHHEELMQKVRDATTPKATPIISSQDNDDDDVADQPIPDKDDNPMSSDPPSQPDDPGDDEYSNGASVQDNDYPDKTTDSSIEKETDSDLTAEEQQILENAKQAKQRSQVQYSTHHRVVLTPAQQRAIAKQQQELESQQLAELAKEQQTRLSKADTIELANANLKVSTIQGLAKHKIDKQDPNEIVVKLH